MTTIPAKIPNAFDAAARGPDIYARWSRNFTASITVDELTLPGGRVILLADADAFVDDHGDVTLVDFAGISDAETGDDIAVPCDLRPLIRVQYHRAIESALEDVGVRWIGGMPRSRT